MNSLFIAVGQLLLLLHFFFLPTVAPTWCRFDIKPAINMIGRGSEKNVEEASTRRNKKESDLVVLLSYRFGLPALCLGGNFVRAWLAIKRNLELD